MERTAATRHPMGSSARVLLTSVFGPYARDDEHGSRAINPMELYHNQVTRVQGGFSIRMFHRSWGLMIIQANLEAPTTLLDFPTLERFEEEVRTVPYDVVGISSIVPNVGKVKLMCEVVRRHQPQATIVVGGHVANRPGLGDVIDADHVVAGEGVAWFRRFLGEDPDAPIRHPAILSAFRSRTMGVPFGRGKGGTAATVIPSVGCPLGCNFCSTSAMFGGKGRFVSFYEGGDELFEVMRGLEERLQTRSFFVMDENFLLHRKRALRLLERMREHGKAWALYVFSSANALRQYSDDELAGLGVSWVWLGLEGADSAYAKLKGTDSRALVDRLQGLGIRVLGSSIVGLPEHGADNIDRAIDHAVAHDTELHQFMLYTPVPGTPLYAEHRASGTLLSAEECPDADTHGQLRFNYRHPRIRKGEESEYLLRAFRRDFEVNGPSVTRIARTLLRGWLALKDHPDSRVRERVAFETRDLATDYAGALWASERWFARQNPALAARLRLTRGAVEREFGWKARLAARVVGPLVLATLWREERRLSRGRTYEPPTFYEANPSAMSRPEVAGRGASACRWVEPPAASAVAGEAVA
ncbi:MAG TPA: B12-binding domain-containing radical SAM protein [Vicinamibacteria bacterium]|nr:B12-binding domain-containing radical SAM protein [Vicinamibacteria bacterium]